MKKILFVFLAFLVGGVAHAQTDTLYLSDIYTTHIRYNTEVVYVDVASTETVLCKQVDQNKNILAVRAAMPFKGLSSFTVIEANEAIHTYIVSYCQSPKKLVIEAGKKPGAKTAEGSVSAGQTATPLTSLEVVEKVIANSGAVGPRKTAFTLSEALKQEKSLFHLSDKKYDVTVSCDNIMIYKDLIYFVVSITNNSGMAYDCPDASFVIEPKAKNTRYLANDKPLYHKSSSGSLSCAPGKSSKVVYCFDVFTILKEQVLKIYVNEINGQRELCITLNYKDVNKARMQ